MCRDYMVQTTAVLHKRESTRLITTVKLLKCTEATWFRPLLSCAKEKVQDL